MYARTCLTIILLVITTISSCKTKEEPITPEVAAQEAGLEEEKLAILNTLNNETKAAFQRDYEAWQQYWVHDSTITKTYLDFPENTFSESLGWAKIDQFVKDFFLKHPEPEPVPKILDRIDVRLYGKGAWVTYGQHDSIRGLKRETRLMEKVNGQWKIAGMQTTIYGFMDEVKPQ